MKIDNTPAIRAFAEARIDQLRQSLNNKSDSATEGRIDELKLIIMACDGLAKQWEMIYDAFGGAGALALPHHDGGMPIDNAVRDA